MDLTFAFQETSAAAAAITALQQQLKELRLQNQKLEQDLHTSSLHLASTKETNQKQLDLMHQDHTNRESSMKEDLIYLCQRVKLLEHENLSLSSENQKLKDHSLEDKQNQRMIVMLQEEIQLLNKKLQQKESEQELLNKRIMQLEGQENRIQRINESFMSIGEPKSSMHSERAFEGRAEVLDTELSQQKSQYREYLRNPNPGSGEWKAKVDVLRRSIEGNSQELLRLRKDQYDYLKSNFDTE